MSLINSEVSLTLTWSENRLFVRFVRFVLCVCFENEEDRTFSSNYYIPKFKIKGFNVLIDGKPFFEIPVKNKEKIMKKYLKKLLK